MDNKSEKIEGMLRPILAEIGAEIVELQVRQNGTAMAITLLVDKMEGRITLDECSRINVFLRQGLEREEIVPENDFEIDVSSPGLDRPLTTRRDFERALGWELRFYLSEPVAQKKEHLGRVIDMQGDKVLVETKAGKIDIPLGVINKAIYEL